MVKTEGKKKDGKTRLQVGEVWLKKGTALQIASRTDLDLMYRQRMEEEAEDRARKRFKHFTEMSGTPPVVVSSPTQMPVRELLVGPTAELRRFTEELIAGKDKTRFLMLVELVRESLVEAWTRQQVAESFLPDLQKYASELVDFFRDEYLPSIQSIVTVAILIIKYDHDSEWLQIIVEVLLEAFEESRKLQRLKSAHLTQHTDTLQWWRPGFEIYIGLKTVAVYATMRNRPKFIAGVIRRLVVPLSIDNYEHPRTPVLFWPFQAHMFAGNELLQGRATFLWNERISSFWGSQFGSYEKFLAASCELEFLLEFNSHLGTNSVRDQQLKKWIETTAPDVTMTYMPDLYVYRLDLTVPMAERLYDVTLSCQGGPTEWEILPLLFAAALKAKIPEQRIVLYGEFLSGLKAWQSKTMMQEFQRFPFMFDWPGRLKLATDKYRAQVAANNSSR